MNNKEILLTISILVSGTPENVHKCLESLRELREQVPCELLVTDTGCCEATRAIVEEYADEIISFEWCKDFSKARNVGLQHAKGKWFMFLDDDEWFEDTREIVFFFLSGEYENYHHARYYQRNYSNRQGSKYNDAPVLRMMKKTKETTFVYSIHECLYPVDGPCKIFNSFVHHYGYVYDSWEQKLTKAWRNIELLHVECRQQPLDLHHSLQLVQEYLSVKEFEEALRIGKEAIGIWEKYHKKSGAMVLYYNSLMTVVLQCLLMTGQYEALLAQGELYVSCANTDSLARALMLGRMAVGAYELHEYDRCLGCVKKYYDAYLLWVKHPEYYYPYETSLTKPCFERNLLQMVLQCGIHCSLKKGDYERGSCYAETVDWSEGITYINQPLIRELMMHLNEADEKYVQILLTITDKLRERKALEPYFAESILEQENPCWNRYGKLFGELSGTLLDEAWNDIQKQEWKNAVAVLKQINQSYPMANELVKKMLAQISEKSKEEQKPNQEFAALAVAVKKQAQNLLAGGQKEQARSILQQLYQLLPEDEEVIQLMNKCN